MLIVNGVEVPTEAILDFSQSYEPLQASVIHRMGSGGTAKRQTLWTGKLRTVISGQGWCPPGLSGLDVTQSVDLWCVAEQSKLGGVADINIGASTRRRSDTGFEPRAFGIVGIDRVSTSLSVATNGDCSITPVTGATHYQVTWCPRLTVFVVQPITESTDTGAALMSWELVAEEI